VNVAEAKTKATKASVAAFLKSAVDGDRRTDCATLVRMMQDAVGAPAVMWGTAIVGFGTYEIDYSDGRTADWPIIGFSPRKQDLTLYIGRDVKELDTLLGKLGKHKMSGGCLYIKRLSDVDLTVLGKVIAGSIAATRKKHT
jgi:hypothetical protein